MRMLSMQQWIILSFEFFMHIIFSKQKQNKLPK